MNGNTTLVPLTQIVSIFYFKKNIAFNVLVWCLGSDDETLFGGDPYYSKVLKNLNSHSGFVFQLNKLELPLKDYFVSVALELANSGRFGGDSYILD